MLEGNHGCMCYKLGETDKHKDKFLRIRGALDTFAVRFGAAIF